MSQINFNTKLYTPYGGEIQKMEPSPNGKDPINMGPYTLGDACINALSFADQRERPKPDDIVRDGLLIVKIRSEMTSKDAVNPILFEAEEVARMKSKFTEFVAAGADNPYTCIQVHDLLEGRKPEIFKTQ